MKALRLDLGPLERLPAHKDFEVQADFEPMTVGGETIEFEAPVRVRGGVDRIRGGALLAGEVEASVRLRCGRCLDRYATTLRPQVDLFLHGPGQPEREESVPYADPFDLGPVVEEAIVLDLPVRPLCREDCEGLCPRCGSRRGACGCPATSADEDEGSFAAWVREHGRG